MEINPTIAPSHTSPMKCLPRYILEKAINTITKGVNILIILLSKIVTIPPHRAVVSDTCPEGKPRHLSIKAQQPYLQASAKEKLLTIFSSGSDKIPLFPFPLKLDVFVVLFSRLMTLLSTKSGLGYLHMNSRA